MNKALEKALDQATTKRLEAVQRAIGELQVDRIEVTVKSVVIIGTKTATGSLIYMAYRTKDPVVQAILIQQIVMHSPLRQEYRHKLLEIIPDTNRLAQLYGIHNHAFSITPVWHERAETFDAQRIEDTRWLDLVLQGH
ncbi:MAG: hypothetical protein UY31_C0009G0017 [Candidatus Wolfebacteria bacterium GW2011_GWE1_48_7]|uniref:Uncharacterized protein n=2 Tax=Candidatus Wolfeibacteriota TaxID=1752735 RepID=A0A0G1WJH2_9BACT|nr:MAG: hypothetical protein UX70_C0001G0461 [Candidatus Wolfebacteria bacterium GW2011_GWB1_47_1]KKU37179.1 MAG: hypothetical protein UX49_C0001G0049 [Candidatus Wolfebacteria bacterium GW2011_GWC2_46_275]KKU42661.1 MAG: hypothetical protein UX58_C0001G0093 [Candidatus Wolfebacteria bacterium GW2011_GWB2_46_69]KKU54604.1 MAG: hypothetical protein UX76_C0001G0063 [Candidatus Wolfebacteria bacterium GW2011_GWC1_47_103]KKU59988.1 MAG: hypothetical protein UX83_C0001G0063 [Candidatus Wolfebacteria